MLIASWCRGSFIRVLRAICIAAVSALVLLSNQSDALARTTNASDQQAALKFNEACSAVFKDKNSNNNEIIKNCFQFIVDQNLFRRHSIPRKIEGDTTPGGDNFWDLRAYLLQSNKQSSFIRNLSCVDLQMLVYSWLEIAKFIHKINGPGVWLDCAKAVHVTRSVITNDEALDSIKYRIQCAGFEARFLENDNRIQLFEHVYQCLYGKTFAEDGQSVKAIVANCDENPNLYNKFMEKFNISNYGYRVHLAAQSPVLVEWDQLKNIRNSINASAVQRRVFGTPFKCQDILEFAVKRRLIDDAERQAAVSKFNLREQAAKNDRAIQQDNIRNAQLAKIEAEIQACKINNRRGRPPELNDLTNAMNKALFADCNAGGITRRMLKNGDGNPLLSIVGRAQHEGEWCRIQDTGIRHANVSPLRCIRSAENQFECAANVQLACKLFSANDVFGADIMRENLMCSPYRSARYQVVIKLVQDDRCNWALVPD